jgi:hypothetical protein
MAIKHHRIKPFAHANSSYNDRIYVSGAAIGEGDVVKIHTDGKVIEVVDADAGPLIATDVIFGVALNSTSGANEDVLVAIAYPGRMFVGSLTDVAAAAGTDLGAKALALTDLCEVFELHDDAGTGIWVLGLAQAAPTTNSGGRVLSLVDKIGATTNDATTFGSSGGGPGVAMTVSGKTTALGDPAGSNSGKALVAFCFPDNFTVFGSGVSPA